MLVGNVYCAMVLSVYIPLFFTAPLQYVHFGIRLFPSTLVVNVDILHLGLSPLLLP